MVAWRTETGNTPLPDALHRCRRRETSVGLFEILDDIPDHSNAKLFRILNTKVPGIDKRLVEDIVHLVQKIRELDLKKTPSISETLDWARALMVLNADSLAPEIVSDTLNIILKHQGDIQKAQGELSRLLEDKAAEQRATQPQPAQPDPAKKSVLH